jgi:chitin disaccharide deacetylase
VSGLPVIVNADDLGMSLEVNAAIFDLMARGRLSSATIMANAPATRQAANRVAAFPACSFGVHLNLTEFEPLTFGSGARRLVDEHGRMSRAIEAVPASLDLLRAAYDELCAQIERVARLGVPITHLDSHNHVHTRPAFFPVLKALQRRYRIRKVRLSKNFYAPEQPCPPGLVLKKRAFNWALRSMYPTRTTDAFSELLTFHRASAARKRSAGPIELMVHPGAAYAADETAILDGNWIARAGLPLRLISYAQLA